MALTSYHKIPLNSSLKDKLGPDYLYNLATRLTNLYRQPALASKLDKLADEWGYDTFEGWDAESLSVLSKEERCLLENYTRKLKGEIQVRWSWRVYYLDGNQQIQSVLVQAYTRGQAEGTVRSGKSSVSSYVDTVLAGKTKLEE